MNTGEKLRNLRLKMKKTLKEQSIEFGVSLNSIYRWEHGLTMPRKRVLMKMAEYYDVSLEWLLQDDDDSDEIERQLLNMFRVLSDRHKYQFLGYVERIYTRSKNKETVGD